MELPHSDIICGVIFNTEHISAPRLFPDIGYTNYLSSNLPFILTTKLYTLIVILSIIYICASIVSVGDKAQHVLINMTHSFFVINVIGDIVIRIQSFYQRH